MIISCVKDLEETKTLDPEIEKTPASVSKFQSNRGMKYRMTFSNPKEVSKDEIKQSI